MFLKGGIMSKIHKVDFDRLVRLFEAMGYTTDCAKQMAMDRLIK